jgi:hypothetical protein
VTEDLGIGIVCPEGLQELEQYVFLESVTGVGRIAVLVESSLVADTDATGIKAFGMCSDHLFRSSEMELTVPGDVVVVTAAAKAPSPMVAFELLEAIAFIAPRSRAVDDDLLYLSHKSSFEGERGGVPPSAPKHMTVRRVLN